MTTELTMLAWSIVLGLVHVVLTGQLSVLQFGMAYGLSPRDEEKRPTGIPGRVTRAFANYMQTFPFFAAAVLVAHVANRHSNWTVYGAELYFWCRLVFVPLYASGIPGPRTLAYLGGVVGIAMILIGLT